MAGIELTAPATMKDMAAQINRCAGPSGPNRDYVLSLARSLRDLGYSDSHVFELESWVLGRLPGHDGRPASGAL